MGIQKRHRGKREAVEIIWRIKPCLTKEMASMNSQCKKKGLPKMVRTKGSTLTTEFAPEKNKIKSWPLGRTSVRAQMSFPRNIFHQERTDVISWRVERTSVGKLP